MLVSIHPTAFGLAGIGERHRGVRHDRSGNASFRQGAIDSVATNSDASNPPLQPISSPSLSETTCPSGVIDHRTCESGSDC